MSVSTSHLRYLFNSFSPDHVSLFRFPVIHSPVFGLAPTIARLLCVALFLGKYFNESTGMFIFRNY